MLVVISYYTNIYKNQSSVNGVGNQKEDEAYYRMFPLTGIERALRKGWRLKVYYVEGTLFATLSSNNVDRIKVQAYNNNFYVSEILRQVSGKFLCTELYEQKTKKESPLDAWIKDGNELFGIRDGDSIKLEIRRDNQSLIPTTPQPTFAHAYEILNQIEYSPKLSGYLSFIAQARKALGFIK